MALAVDPPKHTTRFVIVAGVEAALHFPVFDWSAWIEHWCDMLYPTVSDKLGWAFPHLQTGDMACGCRHVKGSFLGYSLCKKHHRQWMKVNTDGSLDAWIEAENMKVRALISKDPRRTAEMLATIHNSLAVNAFVITHTDGHETRMELPPIIRRAVIIQALKELEESKGEFWKEP